MAVVKITQKGRGKRTAVIPLLTETRELLSRIRTQQIVRNAELAERAKRLGRAPPTLPLTVLSNTFGRSWRYSGLETRIGDTKAAALPPIKKHIHDARGTLATRFRQAGLTAPEIADVFGWDEDQVEKLMVVYIDRSAIVKGIAERIQRLEAEARRGQSEPEPAVASEAIELEAVRRQAGGGVVHHVDFRRRPQSVATNPRSDRTRSEIGAIVSDQRGKQNMKRALIDLCAYIRGKGVERRSPLISDEWLGSEIARDPWLFRIVEFEPGYFDLADEGEVAMWPIPDAVAARMSHELKLGRA